jgi:hypothetical protein
MNVDWSLVLSVYATFSVAVSFYAFKEFRKRKERMLFSIIGSFMLIFLWPIPAAKLISQKIKS